MQTLTRAFVVAALVLTTATLHADVLVVRADGSGDFDSLAAAVGAAVNGDILLVQSDFPTEVVTLQGKQLTLVGDAATRPKIAGLFVFQVPAGGSVQIRGLEFGPSSAVTQPGPLSITSCAGTVFVEDCVATGTTGTPTLFDQAGETACYVATSPNVIVSRCVFTGGDGFDRQHAAQFAPGVGGHGLRAEASHVFVYGSMLTGGVGGTDLSGGGAGGAGGPGAGGFTSQLWIEGGVTQGGRGGDDCPTPADGCAGGEGVVLLFDELLELRDAQVSGGTGGELSPPGGSGASQGAFGQAYAVHPKAVVFHPGAASLTAEPGPVREGEAATTSFFGAPGASVGYVLSLGFDAQPLGGSKGLLLVDTPLLGPYFVGTMPASGELPFHFVVPHLGAGLEGLDIAKQGLVADSDGLRLASPSALVLVAASR
ncbi:MAG: hypothetical protein DHS20C15_30070 [Planctomycetota bacterium]|nr:MAG: hypothetical protein DHS20C15_30070 [Planctomycetota bacterium]